MNLCVLACPAHKQTLFVHCHVTSHPSTTSTPASPQPLSQQMGPKPKSNTHSGTVHMHPISCKCQGSNTVQQPTKQTWHTTNNVDNDVNEEREPEQEITSEAEDNDNDDVVDPPPPTSRSGKRGRGVKRGPPQRYVGHDQQ